MRSRSFAPEFFSPLPLIAVAVLALNDHVLKFKFPGLITGKLSDIAGCFVLPLFLSALLALFTRAQPRERLHLSAGVSFLFFTAIKSSQPAADLTCAALDAVGPGCGRIIADPTDLIALPFIAIAAWYGASRSGVTASPAAISGAAS